MQPRVGCGGAALWLGRGFWSLGGKQGAPPIAEVVVALLGPLLAHGCPEPGDGLGLCQHRDRQSCRRALSDTLDGSAMQHVGFASS